MWQQQGGYEYEYEEKDGGLRYTGWYRCVGGRLADGRWPEWNDETGATRYSAGKAPSAPATPVQMRVGDHVRFDFERTDDHGIQLGLKDTMREDYGDRIFTVTHTIHETVANPAGGLTGIQSVKLDLAPPDDHKLFPATWLKKCT